MINRWMSLLVDELRGDGISDPLCQSFTLAVVWDDVCRIASQELPPVVRALLEDATNRAQRISGTTPQDGTGEPEFPQQDNGVAVNTRFAALVAELEAEDVPRPLSEPLTLGLIWADLCRLAGEAPPTVVLALLDGVPPDAVHSSTLETYQVGHNGPAVTAVVKETGT